MPSQEEILSRLAALGTTTVGGSSAYAYQIPLLNATGYLDPSLFSSIIIAAVYTVADEPARLSLAGLKPGDTVVQTSPALAFILKELPSSVPGNWVLTGVTDASNATAINYTALHSGGVLSSFNDSLFNALAAIDLGKLSISIANVLTAVHQFNTGAAPFAIGASSAGQLVVGLNAETIGGAGLVSLRDASNLNTGLLAPERLFGKETATAYSINITGNAQTATNAVSATVAITANQATLSGLATRATLAVRAILAEGALDSELFDHRLPAFYRNADNLDAGILLPARFNDNSHGIRAGGDRHASATCDAAGFMSSADFCKLQEIEPGAQPNNNTFGTFTGTTGATSAGTQTSAFKFDSDTPELTIAVSGGATAKATWKIEWSDVLHEVLGGLDVGDDHPQYVTCELNPRNINVKHTFNGPGGPFIIGAAARGNTVEFLDADLLDGRHAGFFQNAANLTGGILAPARLSGTYDINISGAASGGLPISGGVMTGALTVPQITIGSLAGMLKATGGLVTGNATTSELPEGSRLYYTDSRVDARVDTRVAALIQSSSHLNWVYNAVAQTLTGNVTGLPENTDGLVEGTVNKYFTAARGRAALSATAPITYDATSGVIGVSEGYVRAALSAVSPITYNSATGAIGILPGYVRGSLSAVAPITYNSTSGAIGFNGALAGVLVVPQITIGSLTGVLKATAGLVTGNATTSEMPEGSRLYYTNNRVDTRVAALIQSSSHLNWVYNATTQTLTGNVTGLPENTDGLLEGTGNKYFTNARARAALSVVGPVTYDATAGVIGIDPTYVRTSLSASAPITYNSTSGVIGFNPGYVRAALSAVSPITYNSATGAIGIDPTYVRTSLSASEPVTYDSTSGEIGVNATEANTPNTLVFRNSSGNFAAATITVEPPTAGGHATNKSYVDAGLATNIAYADGELATKASAGHIHANASTTVAGFMSAGDKVGFDRLSLLLDESKRARSFCPMFRLEGATTAKVLFYNQRSAFVRGNPANSYTLTVRVRGLFKEQHGWGIQVSNPNEVIWVHEAMALLPSRTQPSPPEYVDREVVLTVNGRAQITLFYYLRDGIAPTAMPGELANAWPDRVTFNNTYLLLEPVSLVGDYNIYGPDVLPISIDGEMVGGLLSGYTANNNYNGEAGDDADDLIRAFTNSTVPPAFPIYTTVTTGKVTTQHRGCQVSALNKTDGFNGYLRPNPFVLGRHPSAAITDDVDHLDEILVNSGKLYQNVVSGSFTLGSQQAAYVINGSTTFQSLFDQIAASGTGKLRASYNPVTDRISITNSAVPQADEDASVFYDPSNGAFLGTVRASANELRRTTVTSLPVASGIRVSDTLKTANFKLPISPDLGSFFIDGVLFNYNASTDTVAATMAAINVALTGTQISYSPLANTFKLEKKQFSFLPPDAYDITGNFLQACNLERENSGNPGFPVAAVHSIYVTETAVLAAGSFRSFKGATMAGLAKLNFDKQPVTQFDTGGGFDYPVSFVTSLAGTTDLLVGCAEPSSFNGYNRKYLFRIRADGSEDTSFNLTTQSISDNGQDSVLGMVSLNSSNDIAVLTSRELHVYDITGTLLCTYRGSRAFHGLVKYEDNQILIASNAYSGLASPQKWDLGALVPLDEPLGLKLVLFNESTNTIAVDPVWLQTPTVTAGIFGAGAGTGAEASCAYPIIGGTGANTYVIAANRGALFGAGYTTGSGDTSWNSREVGNLLIHSERISNPANPGDTDWAWNKLGNVTVTEISVGTDEFWTNLERPDANDVAYISQHVDMSTVRIRLDFAPVTNTGNVGYRYMVKFIQDVNFGNKFPVINVRLSGGATENDRQVNCYVNLATGAVALGTPTPPNMVGIIANSTTVVNPTGGPNTYIVTLSFADDIVANTQLFCTVYPAYASVVGNPVEAITGSCKISAASLQLLSWPSVYTRTTTHQKYPAAGSNSLRFRGMYKIGLGGQKKGAADENWNCTLTFDSSEPHSHAIPFCVDTLNRVYIGGPVIGIKNQAGDTVPVTPWRLYRLTADGRFDKEYDFNDKVLAAQITPCNRLVVGGRFSCCGKSFVGKLAYLSLDGAVLTSLTNHVDLIASALVPDTTEEPCNKNKLWLDTSAVPAVLKAWNADNSDWQAAIDTNSLVPRLPAPEFVVSYPVAGQLVNPSQIYIIVPGHSDATIYYGVNQDPRVLAFRLVYNPVTGIILEEAGTFTVNTYSVNDDFEDSKLASATFTVQPSVGQIEFTPASGMDFEGAGSVAIDIASTNLESMFYQVSVNGGPFTPEALYTGSLTVQQNVQIRARATRTNFRDAISAAVYTIHLAAPVVTYTRINPADPDSSKNGISLSTASPDSVIRYTVDGTLPTMQNGFTYGPVIELLNNTLYTNNQFVLKAKTFNVPNGTESQLTIEPVSRLAVPTFDPTGTGLLSGAPLTLTGSGNPGEVIRYTINGDLPTEDGAGGTTYTGTIIFEPAQITNHTVQLRVRVYRLANAPLWVAAVPSAVVDRVFTVQIPPPTMSLVNTSNLGVTKILLTSVNPQTPSATVIRYTLDGTTPSKFTTNLATRTYEASGIITADIPNINFVDNVVTLKVIEYYVTDTYVPAVAEFTATRCVGPLSVTPTDSIVVFGNPVRFIPATADSYTFYFLTNSNTVINGSTTGRLYNADTGLVFVNNDIINGDVDLRIRAFRSNFLPGLAVSKAYNLKVPAVYYDPFSEAVNPGFVSMFNLVQGVVIKYTLNGASPTEHSRLYSNPVQILVTTSIKAIATKTGWVDSDISVAVYGSTLYPAVPDYCLFNVKYGQHTLASTKITAYRASSGYIVFQGRRGQTTNSPIGQGIYALSDSDAYLVNTGEHLNNVDKYQSTVKGKAAFGLTNVDYWNNLDEGDNENWKPLRNYGGTGNYANYLEARKYFGCSRVPVTNPLTELGPTRENVPLATVTTVPTLLQNSGITAVPQVDKHVMTHIRGLRAGKYLIIAYGQQTRFGIDMYSGTSVTGAEFFNYGVPALKQNHTGKFYQTTAVDQLFLGNSSSTGEVYPWQNPVNQRYYEDVQYNVVVEGRLSGAYNQNAPLVGGGIDVILSGAAATVGANLDDTCNFAVALVESVGENDIEFHINGRYDGSIPFGVNTVSQPILNGIQIIPIEGYYQPEINDTASVLTAGPFDAGDYSIFHVHGGVDVGGTQPKFAGGYYRLTHSVNSAVSGNFNRPDMVAADDPAPNRVTAQTQDTDHPGWYACQSTLINEYWLATNPTSYLEFDFTVANVIDSFTLTVDADSGAPKDFTFQAYDGSNWVVLSTLTDQFTGLTGMATKTFAINTPIPATKYRLSTSATVDSTPVRIYGFNLLGKVEDNLGVTTFINLPEVGRYKTGEAECAAFTGAQKSIHHEGGNLEFAFEDVTEHYNDNLVAPGLIPAAEGAGSRPIKPIFAVINVSKISGQGRGTGGLPVLFDPPSGTVDP